jgi:hypothetical protein
MSPGVTGNFLGRLGFGMICSMCLLLVTGVGHEMDMKEHLFISVAVIQIYITQQKNIDDGVCPSAPSIAPFAKKVLYISGTDITPWK